MSLEKLTHAMAQGNAGLTLSGLNALVAELEARQQALIAELEAKQMYANIAIGSPQFGPGTDVPLQFSVGTFPFRGVEGAAYTGPETVGAGQTLDPFVDGPSVALPEGASLEISLAYFFVSNAAGTQKLRIETTEPIPVIAPCTNFTQSTYLPFAKVAQNEKIGTDLSIKEWPDHTCSIRSAAGGHFFASFWVALSYTPPPDA